MAQTVVLWVAPRISRHQLARGAELPGALKVRFSAINIISCSESYLLRTILMGDYAELAFFYISSASGRRTLRGNKVRRSSMRSVHSHPLLV